MTTWRRLANPQFGSWPLNDEILADWDAGRRERETSGGEVKLALVVRLELVGAGSRGEVDLDGFGPWNAQSRLREFGRRWDAWEQAGYTLMFNLSWTHDIRLLTVPRWLGYWNCDRARKWLQLQSFVMDVAHPDYQRWVVPRILRAFETSGADALHVGVKWDRMERQTVHLAVPGGTLDTRTGAVDVRGASPDVVTATATPGFSEGIREILRQCGVPFLTSLQLVPTLPKTVFTKAEYDAACKAWIGDLAPLWLGNL